MKKTDLISALASKAMVSKTEVTAVLDSLAELCQSQLVAGEELTLPGIGKLATSERAARIGRNPKTGESIEIAASTNVKFSATKSLKDVLNA